MASPDRPDPVYPRLLGRVVDQHMVSKHPTQPLVVDEHGVVRFKRNEVVNYLVDNPGVNLNDIFLEVARGHLPVEDYMQFMQLQGFSVSGYGDAAFSHEWKRWRRHAEKMDIEAGKLWHEWKASQEGAVGNA